MQFQTIAILVPTIIGLVGIFTSTGLVPKKFAPLLVLAFGILLVILFAGVVNPQVILSGVATGIMAMGAYSGVKTTAKAFKKEEEIPAE